MTTDRAIYSAINACSKALTRRYRTEFSAANIRSLMELVSPLRPDHPLARELPSDRPALLLVADHGLGPAAIDPESLTTALDRCSGVVVTSTDDVDLRPLMTMARRRRKPMARVRTTPKRYREWMTLVAARLAPSVIAEWEQ
jgi:hypothetical protein